MSNVFGKVPISAGIPVIENVGGSGLSGILIGNESGLTCTVEMQGANVKRSLYAGTVDFFPIAKGINWNGNLVITPSADLNNISYWPSSFVQIDTFGLNERPSGQYPINLNRTGNVGNQVTTAVGSATSVQNDNNAAGTEFVEATVLGSPSSNTAMFNDGSGWLGRWNNPTFTKIFQWFSSGTTALQLGASAFLSEFLGNLKVDGTTELVGAATLDSTLAVTGTATFHASGVTIDASNAVNADAVNVNTVNGGTINATTTNTASLSATSSITEANNQPLKWKDSGGTARTVVNVDASNNVNISGITGTDKVRFLKSDGTVEVTVDTSANTITHGVHIITPSMIVNNATYNNGTTHTVQCTGVGGVPSGAKAVFCNIFFTPSAASTYCQVLPKGATWTNGNYPIVGTAPNAVNIVAASVMAVLDATGALDFVAVNGNLVGIFVQMYAFVL